MFMVLTSPLFSRIWKKLPPNAVFHRIDNVNCKVRIRRKALSIFACITFTLRVHDLPRSNLADKLAERRRGRSPLIYWHHFFWSRDKPSLVASLAELVDSDVLQLGKVNPVTKDVQLLHEFQLHLLSTMAQHSIEK